MLPLRKPFDTSGKSAAQFHHRAICKAADGAAHRALGAMTSQKSRQLKISPARPRRMIACVLPYRARLHPRGLRRFRRERNSRPDPHVSGQIEALNRHRNNGAPAITVQYVSGMVTRPSLAMARDMRA
jgi:hypothetical protein